MQSNGVPPQLNPDSLGIDVASNGSVTFPYGHQWMYPCGGMPTSTNRSLWPVTGGAVAFQPGWYPGHQVAFIYINIGINGGMAAPPNMSNNVVPPFQIVGPTNDMWPGTVCLPQVPLPKSGGFKVGDNMTIQVVETAQHGAALYNCADVTLADPKDVPLLNSSTCFNTSTIGINYLFTASALSSAAWHSPQPLPLVALGTILLFSFLPFLL